MAQSPAQPRKRSRGRIEPLPSGAFRVKVSAGIDPISGARHYLTEIIPAGPAAAREAEKARTRLLNQLDERRAPRTGRTVDQLMDRYVEVMHVEPTTRDSYERNINNHIRPLLGRLKVGRVDGEVLDSFDAQLRRCRSHCDRRSRTDHRVAGDHDCDRRCREHRCQPLSEGSIRKIHGVLNVAFGHAVRWRWLGVNPMDQAAAPAAPKSRPTPPSAEQAARIVREAWKDPAWGMLVWLVMVTGIRRGELCALRWSHVDPGKRILTVAASIAQSGRSTWEKETKTGQRRSIALDETTVALLQAYWQQVTEEAVQAGLEVPDDAMLFSLAPDHSRWLVPSSVSNRYRLMCARLGWKMHIHQLRHYSATELVASGVDLRTVAGRLGHSGGGATTLRVYSAWRPEADQRAASTVADGLPTPTALAIAGRPSLAVVPAEPDPEYASPYQRVAADLEAAIRCGILTPGDLVPTVVELAARYNVAASTAHRAIAELAATGAVNVSRGKRATVT